MIPTAVCGEWAPHAEPPASHWAPCPFHCHHCGSEQLLPVLAAVPVVSSGMEQEVAVRWLVQR